MITSDRGLAGAYSSSVLKEAERLRTRLEDSGLDVDTYVSGRKGEAFYKFRNREIIESWTGHSDQPTYDVAEAIGNALIGAFLNDEPEARTIEEDGERPRAAPRCRRGARGLHPVPLDAGAGAA